MAVKYRADIFANFARVKQIFSSNGTEAENCGPYAGFGCQKRAIPLLRGAAVSLAWLPYWQEWV